MIDVTIPTGTSVGANSNAPGEVGGQDEQGARRRRRRGSTADGETTR